MIETFLATHNINLIQLILVTIGYLMPIPLSVIALNMWHHYKTEEFIAGIKWVLIEVQVPRDVVKSPMSMELLFASAFYHRGKKPFWWYFIQGGAWLWFSLEMVSIDGRVHFFIRTPTRLRELVETQIYAQYPQAKVVEVDDYTLHVPQYSKDGPWHMWGCEFTKQNHDGRPIKTYRDFEELKSGTEEEFKVDPITPTIEFLGSLSRGEQVWVQIIIRQSIKTYHSHKTGKHVEITDATKEEIETIMKPYGKVNDVTDVFTPTMMTHPILAPLIKNMVRQMSLLHFDCGIRLVVLGRKDLITEERFKNTRFAARLIFRSFSMLDSNELIITNLVGAGALWADPMGTTGDATKKRMLNWYRGRIFFHPPLSSGHNYPKLIEAFLPTGKPKIFVMSTEELATIFHFPGMVSETPSFKRIESKIAKPPSNLPS